MPDVDLPLPGPAEPAAGRRYRDPRTLREHRRAVLQFYRDGLDTRHGGLIAQLDERDGHVYDGASRHLVATARATANFALLARETDADWYRTAAEHAHTFLRAAHWDPEREGYDWLLEGREPVDATRYAYGHAFVVLAGARAHDAGIPGGRETLERAAGVLDERFRDDRGLYADRASPDWDSVDDYRGQNANMHACEAFLAAYEATDDRRYLERALTVAEAFVGEVAAGGREPGLLWEHYTADWEPDYAYNREDPSHRFRPWGYQPGHHLEWAKLLWLCHRHAGDDWLRERAADLFAAAVEVGWDTEYGGFYYTVDADGEPVDADKYGWPVAEGIGAAALLSARGEPYREAYDRLWAYAQARFVNPVHGNWYERLARDHARDGPNRGVAVEPGYHPVTNVSLALERFGES